jgi:hypothetical protein
MPYAHPDKVIEELWRPVARGEPPSVYAILDGARDERIYPAVQQFEGEVCCLYRGELDADLASAAPYLLQLGRDAPFTTWLVNQGWGDSWGVFLHSAAPLDELRRHFRRFLMVHDHTGKPMYFRYYDPRVLRVYLPTCNTSELNTLFGPVNSYFAEDENPDTLLEFALRRGTIASSRRQLVATAEVAP